MNILIIQGPNLNLIGLRAAQLGQRLTLDKINKGIRRHVRNTEHELKIIQTHKVDAALSWFQRRRNWADGILFAPMGWCYAEYAFRDVIELISPPVIEVHFSPDYEPNFDVEKSILAPVCFRTIIAPPERAFLEGLDHFFDTQNR
ncbi:MAG: type II 3-dehydroquinate dehydratase [Candidatus Neomarinimicrobiota bacterium]|nr:MAG: type II 3-dehydroquinate dehydratase [Candidatus Neomarinimicrobiota bacterium]